MLDFGLSSEKEIRVEFGRRLRAQRLVKGISQADLAERAGLSLSTVKLFENRGRCTFENFVRLVIGLGLVDELQPLFALKNKSIAQMEQADKATRLRAPRKPRAEEARPIASKSAKPS